MELFNNLPEKLRGDDWFRQPNKQILLSVLNILPENSNVLEIGSYLGRSTSFILNNNKKINLHAIDTWKGSEEHSKEQKEDLFNRFKNNMNLLNLTNRISIIKDDSSNLLNHYQPEFFNLIYIDGSHEEHQVYKDVTNSMKILKPGGFLVGDDWDWRSVCRGAVRALYDYSERNNDIFQNPFNANKCVYWTDKHFKYDSK